MDINLSISPATSITNNIAVIIYKASSPNVIADSQEFAPPHTSPRNITFANVDPETYIVNTYSTPGLPVTGTLRHSFIYDPSFLGVEIKPTEFLYMVAAATSYTDTSWIGWDIESIERVGLGTQFENGVGANISIRTDGFDLTVPGDQFGNDEKWVVRFYPKISISNPLVRSSKIIRSFRIIDSDETLTDADAGVGLRLAGVSGHFTVTLPDLTTIEDASMYVFISEGGSHTNVTINGNGFNFDFRGAVSEIILGQNEYLWVMNDNGNNEWVVVKCSDSIKQTGRIIEQYDNDIERSCVFAAGQLLSRTTNKRLWNFVNQLPSGSIVAEASWSTDKGKYTKGDLSTNFRVPQLYTSGFLRGVDGSTRLAGSHEAEMIGPHTHPYSGGVAGNYGDDNNYRLLAESGTTNTDENDGTENRPDNTGVYKIIQA